MVSDFWAILLGAERLRGGQVEHYAVHWTRLETPLQALLFVLAFGAGCYGVWWFYRREPAYCARRRKLLLAGLRAAALFVLLLILAGPVLQIVNATTVRSKVVVLVDVSKSMARQEQYVQPADLLTAARVLDLVPLEETDARKLPPRAGAGLAAATRLDLVRALLKHPQIKLLDRLKRDNEVELWTFARATDLVSRTAEHPLDEHVLDGVEATGVATEIGGTLRAVADRLKGQPLAGILLLTDGANNRGEEPSLVAEELPAPVFPIGFGVPETRDLAVGHVFMESKLFLDDPAPVYVRLKHHGLTGESCQLVVTLGNEELARQSVVLRGAGEQTEVLRVRPKKPGRNLTLRVEVPPLAGEGELANNSKEREVEVLDKKIKVLIVENQPRWEYRFLCNALKRDKRVELKVLLRVPDLAQLATPGSPFIREFPKKEDLFKFDVVVFGNLPHDSAWTAPDLENLRRFVVAEGGGLWMIAGRNAFPDTYKDSKLELLIPVEFERQPEVDAEDERHAPLTDGFRALLTPEGKTHSLMRLDAGTGAEEENIGLWELLPDLYWYHKALRPKLGATVLLVHGGSRGAKPALSRTGPAPLLVASQVGRGRVLYSAVEELWRMRYPLALGPDALDRFYGHAVQYLGLVHCLGGSPRIEITTDRDEYAVGDRVKVSARILTRESYHPSTADKVAAVAQDLDHEARVQNAVLTPVPGQPGMFRGEIPALERGDYRVAVKEEEEEGAYKDYHVRIPQIELDAPEMKKDWLEQIARASRPGGAATGARFYLPDEAGAIPDQLKGVQRRLEDRLEDPLWDAPLMLILFTLFIGAEWLIRKRSDLC